jgi:hypothetical protein
MYPEIGREAQGENLRESMRSDDEKYWRKRAKQTRALAVPMADRKKSILLTDLADEYEKLADHAALRPKAGSW